MPVHASQVSDAAIAASARALSALYWDLAEELRGAAVVLSTAIGAGDDMPVVDLDRLAAAIKAGMILNYLAARGRR